jgi:uroporphyrinogen-III synthase
VPSLAGKVLAITRSRKEAEEFFRLVRKEGGKAIAVKAIEIVPEAGAAKKFLKLLEEKKHDYCAFMSAQAVRVLFRNNRKAASALASTSVIAVGPKTRQELEKRGIKVAMMPKKYSSIGLAELLSKKSVKSKRIIIPRSGKASDYAAGALEKLGMEVDEVYLYRARTAKTTQEWKRFHKMLLESKIDAIVFTSASNVRSFFEITDSLGRAQIDRLAQVVSIGPFTSAELAKRRIRHHEAGDHTIEGTIEAAKMLFTSRSG